MVRASADGFHRPRRLRYQRGELSAEGYYRDSFDHLALVEDCLLPFGVGAARVRTANHDHRADAEVGVDAVGIPARAVLIVDGVFLLREELRSLWTLSVHLRVSPEESLRRARVRDVKELGSRGEVDRRYLGRYLPGQAIYCQEVDPEAVAHVVVDNDNPSAPVVIRWEPFGQGR